MPCLVFWEHYAHGSVDVYAEDTAGHVPIGEKADSFILCEEAPSVWLLLPRWQ